MKNILYIVVLLVFTTSFGQNKEISLDYTVTYEIPNAKKNTIDTISVSYNKEGTYLHSNARILINEFNTSIFKNSNVDVDNSTSNIIYDTNKTEIYMHLDIQGNIVFMKMNLDAIIPTDSNSVSENFKVITEKAEKDTFLLNKSYPTYLIYPESEPHSKMTMVIDENHSVNNNNILAKFFELMLAKTNSSGNIEIDIPEGLILSITESEKTIIKAIDIDTKPIKIKISHSFNIEK